MPEMDGIPDLAVTRREQCKARIVLMSGINIRVIETAKKLAQTLGLTVIGHLQKPFPLSQLKDVLGTNLSPERRDCIRKIRNSRSLTRTSLAFDRNEFVIYYQPQINISTGSLPASKPSPGGIIRNSVLSIPDNFISRIETWA